MKVSKPKCPKCGTYLTTNRKMFPDRLECSYCGYSRRY